jgi:ATP-dependent Clp protease ATP-binding subunit ClpA
MYERFTDTVRQSMIKANREAERDGNEYIGSLHILIGLIDTSPTILDTGGIDTRILREFAAEIASTTPCAGANQAIENTLSLAVEYKSVIIDVPHVMLGILITPDESVTALFERMELDLDVVRGHVMQRLSTE